VFLLLGKPNKLACGDRVSGSTIGSPVSLGRTPGDVYSMSVSESTQVTLSTCDFADFDTYVVVADETHTFLCEDDDSCGMGLKSHVSCAVPPGDYLVLVTGFSDSDVGSYNLDVVCSGRCYYQFTVVFSDVFFDVCCLMCFLMCFI